MTKRKCRIAVIDGHEVIRLGIEKLCESAPDLELVMTAGDGIEFLLSEKRTECDIVIMEYETANGGMSAQTTIRRLNAENPKIKIMIFTYREDEECLRETMSLGVHGHIVKSEPVEVLLKAIKNIDAGLLGISPRLSPMLQVCRAAERENEMIKVMGRLYDRLTDREREMLDMLAAGKTSREIAGMFRVKQNTVNKHRENIRAKLGRYNIHDLFLYIKNQ